MIVNASQPKDLNEAIAEVNAQHTCLKCDGKDLRYYGRYRIFLCVRCQNCKQQYLATRGAMGINLVRYENKDDID